MSRLATRLRRLRHPYAHRLDVDGRHVEVRPDSTWRRHTLRLIVDGELVDERSHTMHPFFRLEGGGVAVRARTNQLGNVLRAEVVRDEGDVLLVPEPGSPAAKLERLARERPRVYAARHVAKAVVGALVGLLVAGAVLGFLVPDLGLQLPSVDVPDWAEAAIEGLIYAVPVLVGAWLARREFRARRRRHELRAPGR